MVQIKRPFLKLFIIQLSLVVVLVLGAIFLYGGVVLGSVSAAMEKFMGGACSDFGQYLYFLSRKDPFHGDFVTMYTPLNLVLLYPFTFFSRSMELFDTIAPGNGSAGTVYNLAVTGTWQFWVDYSFFVAVFIVGSVFLLKGLMPKDMPEKEWLILSLVFSNFGLFAISRGSNVQQIFLLVLLYLRFYRAKNPILREIALICLAAAGVCKYYPFIFGVLLLKRKDFFGAVRVVVYSALLFTLPFLCFGGFEEIPVYFSNLGEFVIGEDRVATGTNLSIYSIVYKTAYLFGVAEDSLILRRIALVCSILCLVLTATLSFFAKDRFSEFVLFNVAMTLVCPVSYYYIVTFLMLPIVVMGESCREMEKWRRTYYFVFFSVCGLLPSLAITNKIFHSLMYVCAIAIEWIHIAKTKKKETV